MERLYSCNTGRHGPSEESDGVVDVEQEDAFREAEAVADEIDGRSRVVAEVLRIKHVLDNSRLELASALCELLRRLQSMAITLEILETTKIRISVDSLRRSCRSKQITQLADSIIGEKNLANQKRKRQLWFVTPNRSSQTDSRTTPSDNIAVENFDEERKVQLGKPNEVDVRNRQLADQKDVSRNRNSRVLGYPCGEKLTMDLCSLRGSSTCRRL
ncbi:hypothetical protein BT93_K1109 [Corymbia citriodora subsp. variegata]|nr:hypothetical protein BT93_K1109 [Corymbia citriodora subsp. variegata]